MTLLSFKQKIYNALENHYPTTEIDSFFKIILIDVLQLSKIDFALNPHDKINEVQEVKIDEIIEGLSKQQPIQYLIGFTEFMDLKLAVNKNVLIPRPETEELILWIIDDFIAKKEINILDIGTGSGCIPIALKKGLKTSKVTTVDVSANAIDLARENANNNQADICFIHQDILSIDKLEEKYDVIVSNPPYVRELEKQEMQVNVLDYEPHLALFVDDNNPLIFYKKIAELAKGALKPNGVLYFEINQYLGKETVALLKEIGFQKTDLKKDLFGNDRMIKAVL